MFYSRGHQRGARGHQVALKDHMSSLQACSKTSSNSATYRSEGPVVLISENPVEEKLLGDEQPGVNVTTKVQQQPEKNRQTIKSAEDETIEDKLVHTVEPPDGGWGWVIVISSFIIHIIVDGITYSFGVMFVALLEDFQAGKGDTAWIASIFVGMTLGTGPIASGLVNLYGCRAVTIAGAVIGALGFVISPFAPNIWFLYASIGVLSGFGFGLIYLPAIVIVSYYFEKRRALATGIACCGSGVGTFVISPLMQVLVDEYGWKLTCFWLAGLLLQCCIFGALFRPLPLIDNTEKSTGNSHSAVEPIENGDDHKKPTASTKRSKPADGTRSTSSSAYKLHSINSLDAHEQHGHQLKVHIPLHRKDVFYSRSLQNIPLYQKNKNEYITSNMSIAQSLHQVKVAENQGKTTPELKSCCGPEFTEALKQSIDMSLLKNWAFLLFLCSNFLTNLGFNAPFLFIPDRAKGFGITPENAAYLLSTVGVANTIGRVLFGYVADLRLIKPHRLYLYNVGLLVAGLATVFSFATSFVAQIVYCIVFGVFIGCYVSLTAVVLVDLLGVDKLTSSFGMTLLVQGVAVLIGPPACGWIYDGTGSYLWPFAVTGVCIALSGFVLFFIPLMIRCQHRHVTRQEADLGVRIGLDLVTKAIDEESVVEKNADK